MALVSPVQTAQPDGLRRALEPLIQQPIAKVVFTDNRSRILSARATEDGMVVRVHRCFATAPETLLPSVAALIAPADGRRRASIERVRRTALASVRAYFDNQVADSPPKRPPLTPKGRCFDLAAMRDEINVQEFAGRLSVDITWGRWGTRKRRARTASIRLGSFDQRLGLVRIHPTLDAEDVPRYVVMSVVHHEMLHADLPARARGGRRVLHSPEFRRRERLFADHARAERWIAANLDRLLRRSPR